jgi:hypothetical protein
MQTKVSISCQVQRKLQIFVYMLCKNSIVVQIYLNLKKICSIVFLSAHLAWNHVREITHLKIKKKTIIGNMIMVYGIKVIDTDKSKERSAGI